MQKVTLHIEYDISNKCKLEFYVPKKLSDDNDIIKYLLKKRLLDSQEAKHIVFVETE